MTATATPVAGQVPAPGGVVGGQAGLGSVRITAAMAHQLAVEQKVCVRPIIRRVLDRATGVETQVAIRCGSTREAVCPSCADQARRLRMQQCAEGWHRTDEPETDEPDTDGPDQLVEHQDGEDDQGDDDQDDEGEGVDGQETAGGVGRRVRSTRHRHDVVELPAVVMQDRTVGRVFTAPDGREYRPSMFLTLTLPSYGRVRDGVPVHPDGYDYRRAAMDALHFPRLVDRFWQNLRRCAGYNVQYFAAVEPQHRLAPHLHAAIRGAIPRATLRQVVQATYLQLWWPRCDRAVFVHRTPIWCGTDYIDPDTGEALPTWDEAVDAAADLGPGHVMRFGTQLDLAGIIAPSPDADRAVRYLTKYLTKSVADACADPDQPDPAYQDHIDRLHAELIWLPCSEQCGNWLRYGIQPRHAGPGLHPGRCPSKAHDRDHLGLGGRRVLVSRHWSGKTLTQHRADRADIVRQTLLDAGLTTPDIDRLAATTQLPDGRPRYLWTDQRPDPSRYPQLILATVMERILWRHQYDHAKTLTAAAAAAAAGGPVDNYSATPTGPDG